MPFLPEPNRTSKEQPLSPSASSAVHTEIKTMSSVSANMVLISLVCAGAPTLHGGSAPKPERDWTSLRGTEERYNFDSTETALPLPEH